MSEAEVTSDVAALTVQLLSAYFANNTVASEDLAGLIRSTRDALTGEVAATAEPEAMKLETTARRSRGPGRKTKASEAPIADASLLSSDAPLPEQEPVEDAAAAAPTKQDAKPAKAPRA